jgi:hypothetical protein
MTDTHKLIEQLAGRAQPVSPIGSPSRRTLAWLLIAAVLIALISTSFGVRPHLWKTMTSPGEAIEFLGSVLTGACAAYAAFQVSVPGRSGSWAWLPCCRWRVARRHRRGLRSAIRGDGPGGLRLPDAQRRMRARDPGDEPAAGLVMVLMVRHAGVVRPGPTRCWRP